MLNFGLIFTKLKFRKLHSGVKDIGGEREKFIVFDFNFSI